MAQDGSHPSPHLAQHATTIQYLHALLNVLSPPSTPSDPKATTTKATRRPKAARRTNAELFYQKLADFKLDKVPGYTTFLVSLIQSPSLDTLLADHSVHTASHSSMLAVPHQAAAFLWDALSIISSTQASNEQNSVIHVLLCIFLYVARYPDPRQWFAESEARRMGPVGEDVGHDLWEKYMVAFAQQEPARMTAFASPEPQRHVVGKTKFVTEIKRHVKDGSRYAFIARNTSLSTVVYLSLAGLCNSASLNACSKGGKASDISREAFLSLCEQGARQRGEEDGLERALHMVLWSMVAKLHPSMNRSMATESGWARFPGFE